MVIAKKLPQKPPFLAVFGGQADFVTFYLWGHMYGAVW